MSLVQLTNAGVALIQSNTGPVVVTSFELGSAYNYTPEPTDTNIHGTLVYTGTPAAPLAVNGNVVRYSMFLDYPIGPFSFGEIGLFVGDTLFALASLSQLVEKVQLSSSNPGNAIQIDMYLSMVGENYAMWLGLNPSATSFRMAILQSPDYLPASQNAVPNAYIIQGANTNQSAFFAYTDTNGIWNFDAYAYADQASATITSATNQSVTIAIGSYVDGMSPAYFGEVILQFTSGSLYGIVRYVQSAVVSGNSVTLNFLTPLAIVPDVGDTFIAFGRQILSTTITQLPVATSSVLGGVIVGTTLSVTTAGVLNLATTAIPVLSVNGQTGTVELTAGDIVDIAEVAISGQYSDLINTPAPYSLPAATTNTLGGVIAPPTSEGHITIASNGLIDLAFNPVKSVNGIEPDPSSGNVEVPVPTPIGLINPASVAASTDLNTITTTGLYFIPAANTSSITNGPSSLTLEATLEVLPFTTTGTGGDVIQRVTTINQLFYRGLTGSTWSAWTQVPTVQANTEQTATATTAGQTVFPTLGYTVGSIEAYIAGLRMVPGLDYTATDGTNIVIVNSALAAQVVPGTRVTFSSFSSFAVADVITPATLAASSGAALVGYNSTTVAAELTSLSTTLASITSGTYNGAFAGLTASGSVVFNEGTNSTSTGTGTLVISNGGGLGVSGSIYATSMDGSYGTFTTLQSTSLSVSSTTQLTNLVVTGTSSFPTQPTGTNNQEPATTAFVINEIGSLGGAGVSSFNTRTGAVTLLATDVVTALDASALANTAIGYNSNNTLGNFDILLGAAATPQLSSTYKASTITLSGSNLTATFASGQGVVLGSTGLTSGKYYFEVEFVSGTTSGNAAVGVAPITENLTSQVGYNDGTGSAGIFQTSGNIYHDGGTAGGSSQSFATATNVVCVAVDVTNRLIWFRTGAGNWNGNASYNPATDTGGVPIGGTAAMYPAICTDSASVWTINLGATAFTQTAPSGYSSWYSAAGAAGIGVSDVLVSGPANNQVLTYNSTAAKWENLSLSTNTALLTLLQSESTNIATDTGTANAYVAAFSPALSSPLTGVPFFIQFTHANTGASTLNATGTVEPLVGAAHSALQGGEILANSWGMVYWNATITSYVLMWCSGGAEQVTVATQSNQAVTLGQVNGVFSGKNRIINGACEIATRSSGVYTTSINGYGGPDRYAAINSSTGGQFTQSQGSITYNGVTYNAVVQTVNTAVPSLASGNYWSGISQRIEGLNCWDLMGQQITLSFLFETNVTGTYSVALQTAGSTVYTYVSTFTATANTPEVVTIVFATVPTATAIPNSSSLGMALYIGGLNTGTYQTLNVNSWQSSTYLTASTATTNWGATASNYIAATNIQLEAGSHATLFERRQYGEELALCQRYYQFFGNNSTPDIGGYQVSGGGLTTSLMFPVWMRSSPSGSIVGTWATSNCGQPAILSANFQGANLYVIASATGTIGCYPGGSGIGVAFSAEL